MTEERATVQLTRCFDAAPKLVFEAWVDPGRAQRWMAAPALGEELVRVELDARVGRTFAFVVRRQGDEIHHTGEYLEIVPARRLVFTWVEPSVSKETTLVTIKLQPARAGTELTLKHERVLPGERDRTEARWSRVLDVIATMPRT